MTDAATTITTVDACPCCPEKATGSQGDFRWPCSNTACPVRFFWRSARVKLLRPGMVGNTSVAPYMMWRDIGQHEPCPKCTVTATRSNYNGSAIACDNLACRVDAFTPAGNMHQSPLQRSMGLVQDAAPRARVTGA